MFERHRVVTTYRADPSRNFPPDEFVISNMDAYAASLEPHMLELGAIILIVLVVWAIVVAGVMMLKSLVALLFLPIRLILSIVLLPVLLLKALIGGILMLVVLPIAAIAAVVGFIALALALAVPLLPLAFIGLVIWFVLRAARPPAIAA